MVPKPKSRFRPRPWINAALGLLILAVGAEPARATEFQVVNEAGTPQASVDVYLGHPGSGESAFHTNAYGQVSIDAAPGQTLYFARARASAGNYCQPPEGQGASYTVPTGDAESATVTLPKGNGDPAEPGLSPEERAFVGRVNALRKNAEDLPPLHISLTLSAAADAYASYGSSVRADWNGTVDCLFSNPEARVIDAGWPVRPDVVEIDEQGSIPYGNNPWRQQLLDPDMGVIGLADVSGYWTVELSPSLADGTPGLERAQITADTGDIHADDPPPEADPEGPKKDPGFRLGKIRRHGLRYQVTARIKPQAVGNFKSAAAVGVFEGRVQVVKSKTVHRRGGKVWFRGKVLDPGRWIIGVTFNGSHGWDNAGIGKTVRFR
jgi:hypothetical protein